jgi:hypothetical protein
VVRWDLSDPTRRRDLYRRDAARSPDGRVGRWWGDDRARVGDPANHGVDLFTEIDGQEAVRVATSLRRALEPKCYAGTGRTNVLPRRRPVQSRNT